MVFHEPSSKISMDEATQASHAKMIIAHDLTRAGWSFIMHNTSPTNSASKTTKLSLLSFLMLKMGNTAKRSIKSAEMDDAFSRCTTNVATMVPHASSEKMIGD